MPRREWCMTRQDLYDQLWSKPLADIAAEQGIGYNELLNVCSEFKIPKPPRGYWMKVQHGKRPAKHRSGLFRSARRSSVRSTCQSNDRWTLRSLNMRGS